MKPYRYILPIIFTAGLFLQSCTEFLEEKPSKSIVVPTSVEDLQSILNAIDNVNVGDSFGLILSDDIFITEEGLLGLADNLRAAYRWERQLSNPQGEMVTWSIAYGNIFKFNVVLEEAEKIIPINETEEAQLRRVKGTALFLRAINYFELLQLFSHPVIIPEDLNREGIPLVLRPDLSNPQGPSSIGEVYDQLIEDLTQAEALLPEIGTDALRPSKVACNGLLARVYLQLGAHEQALHFANRALSIQSALLDFKTLPSLDLIPVPLYTYTIPRLNEEVVFQLLAGSQSYMYSDLTFVNQEVYDSYDENDIRKYLYFTAPDEMGRVNYVGSFSGDFWIFSGITVGELILIQAETLARLGREEESLNALNQLLERRFYEGTFIPYSSENTENVMQTVLEERRREMIYRGSLRWMDMRRFLRDNTWEGVNPRTVGGIAYDLGTNPENYFIEIPLNEQERNDAL